jgi:leader peptidase (prepilin peptidase) / N-methyltransferase
MLALTVLTYIFIALFGMMIGSFLNVCIIRIPEGESIVTTPSHCMKCGKKIKWYELVPVFSWLLLRGRCSGCKSPISAQYPLIEAATGILYTSIYYRFGYSVETLIYCSMTSALLALSVIDFRTFEIPSGFNIFLLIVGAARVVTDLDNWLVYLIGFCAVSIFLLLVFFISRGRGIGGGDIKLMAVCGLILGWKLIIAAFIIGCVLGSVIHLIRMAVTKEGSVLALGPYLSIGVFIAAMWGGPILSAYLGLFSIV